MKLLSRFRAGKAGSAVSARREDPFRAADRGILLISAIVIMPVVLLIALAGLGWI